MAQIGRTWVSRGKSPEIPHHVAGDKEVVLEGDVGGALYVEADGCLA